MHNRYTLLTLLLLSTIFTLNAQSNPGFSFLTAPKIDAPSVVERQDFIIAKQSKRYIKAMSKVLKSELEAPNNAKVITGTLQVVLKDGRTFISYQA